MEYFLDKFAGKPIEMTRLSSYQQWAYDFFHTEHLANPNLTVTLQLSITKARANYERYFQSVPKASFNAFLSWKLLQTLKRHPDFNTRHIDGKWYQYDNLPLYFPVAVGGDRRFMDVIIDDVNLMDWSAFVNAYRAAIEGEGAVREEYAGNISWHLFTFIGFLPYLPFTSLTMHRSSINVGRPFFYFGQRQNLQGEWSIPCSITFDHANADPLILNELLADYQQELLKGV